jgi:hypothetical protein
VAQLITIYWRDIPAQVIGRAGRQKIKRPLPTRFADAIDTAAMRAGRGGSEAYLADWRRETRPVDGDLQEAVDDEVNRLAATFPEAELRALARAGGTLDGTVGDGTHGSGSSAEDGENT